MCYQDLGFSLLSVIFVMYNSRKQVDYTIRKTSQSKYTRWDGVIWNTLKHNFVYSFCLGNWQESLFLCTKLRCFQGRTPTRSLPWAHWRAAPDPYRALLISGYATEFITLKMTCDFTNVMKINDDQISQSHSLFKYWVWWQMCIAMQ